MAKIWGKGNESETQKKNSPSTVRKSSISKANKLSDSASNQVHFRFRWNSHDFAVSHARRFLSFFSRPYLAMSMAENMKLMMIGVWK